MRPLVIVFAALCCTPLSLSAQPIVNEGTTIFRYVRPGAPVMQVSVWGNVTQPGLYEVAEGTDLRVLLSLAGGPLMAREEPRLRSRIVLEVARTEGGAERLIYQGPLPSLSDGSAPALRTGDVVALREEVRERFGWRDALTVGTALGTVTILVIQALR